MALFLSTVTNKVDSKGRVSVPAPFRAMLSKMGQDSIIVFPSSQHSCLEGFDVATMQEISERLDHYDLFSADQDDLATTIFAESVRLDFDSDGRVTLPLELLKAVHIYESATFVGLGRKFQIWDPKTYEKRKSQARAHVQDKKLTIPQKGDKR
jgi:MraZ protein